MRIERDKLEFFKNLYEEARAASQAEYDAMERHLKQYKGSKDIDPDTEGKMPTQATHVRNITYELVESQITSYIPTPAVTAKMWSEENERNAKSIETLVRVKRNELPFEKHNDMDERFNPIYGGSVWLIEWDESIVTHNTVGDVKITCMSPFKFTGQPHIYDIADMEYCFLEFETTKEDIVRKYGVSLAIAEEAESEENADDKTATLYVCYYKNDDDKVCQYVWSGETELLDIDDYYSRKRKVCKSCGKRKELCNCEDAEYETQSEEYEELTQPVHRSDGTVIPAMSEVYEDGRIVMEKVTRPIINENGQYEMEMTAEGMAPVMVEVDVPKTAPTRIPFYRPSILPVVIRKNTSQEDSLFGQSDCEFIRPQQQAINKIESRILQKLIRGGVYPLVPDSWKGDLDDTVFEQVFRCKPGDRQLYDTLDLQVDISRDVAEAERLYDHAKRILGISDSFQGQYDSSAQSGVAKRLQIQQAAGRLESKRQMKNAAYAEIDKIIFQYYLAYADEPRPAAYKDSFGRMQNSFFNRYDFVERDDAGEYYYNDEYLFGTDAAVDIEKSREVLWQENRANFQQGAYGDPASPQTQLVFWMNMESAHYPFAHDNVERIREEIKRQQEMAQLQAQNQQLQQDVQNRAGYANYLVEAMGGSIQ